MMKFWMQFFLSSRMSIFYKLSQKYFLLLYANVSCLVPSKHRVNAEFGYAYANLYTIL